MPYIFFAYFRNVNDTFPCILKISHKRVLYLKTVPDESCLTCADKDFCRFKDKTKQKTECVCPDMNEGDFCEISLCQTHCQNDGYCELNVQTNAIDCLCQYPFRGKKCEISKFLF